MGRAPVLDDRRPGVPAAAPVDFLDVATAGPARSNRKPFVGPVGDEPDQVVGLTAATERAGEAGERPVRIAQMAGELTTPVLEEIGTPGRAATARADTAFPEAILDMSTA